MSPRDLYDRQLLPIIEFLSEDRPQLGVLVSEDKKRLAVNDRRGKSHRLSPEKVLFRHSAPAVDRLDAHLQRLADDIDVPLLWAALAEDDDFAGKEAEALATVYFDVGDAVHGSAVFRALCTDRLHFRRRGKTFTPRTTEELEQVRMLREAEERAALELERTRALLAARPVASATAQRLERWLRGAADRALEQALLERGGDPARRAFRMLCTSGHLPATADLEVLQANLSAVHPRAVVERAAELQLTAPDELVPCSFAIDDASTREVDDALSARREGSLIRVDVDIADVAAFVAPEDPIDREAARRATTVYLPTGSFPMLPPLISCDRASLTVDVPRPALRTSIWFDDDGRVERWELRRLWVRLGRRLDYEAADRALQQPGEAGEELRLLWQIARGRRALRAADGALLLQRPEWKLSVDEERQISVTPIDLHSPSRMLVGEMMIAANELAARQALEWDLPLIFRVQPAPNEPLPEIDPADPAAMIKLRGLIAPATLSVHPAPHWGLGLAAYTQVTSPLRRYGDLVQQRQLCARLADDTPPYDRSALLKVLANVEGVEQEVRRVEWTVTQRWALEYVAQLDQRTGLTAQVIGESGAGAKVRLDCCGAEGLLQHRGQLEIGARIAVDVDRVAPLRGSLRLLLAER